MPIVDNRRHLKKPGRILMLLVGTATVVGGLTFLALAGDRDPVRASQQPSPAGSDAGAQNRTNRDGGDQDNKDEREKRRPDHFVPSTPENVVWGGFPIDRPPVLTMQSGETVRIDALSQSGATGTTSPTAFFAQ